MSSDERAVQDDTKTEMADATSAVAAPPPPPSDTKKRPRFNFGALGGAGGDRKRGRGMLGLVVGTLTKAKNEDKERMASDAAKKRHMIEQRLQMKLRKDADSVRRAEEAKKEKTLANRKEEDLQLKDSIYKLRRKRLPLLANFLNTADDIPPEGSSPPPTAGDPLASVPRSHPPPLYYLPAVLTPSQAAFLARRKEEVAEAAEKEWNQFKQEREEGIAEIRALRQKVSDEESRQKTEREAAAAADSNSMDTDAPPPDTPKASESTEAPTTEPAVEPTTSTDKNTENKDSGDMDVDDGVPPKAPVVERTEVAPTMQADDDDAVEY